MSIVIYTEELIKDICKLHNQGLDLFLLYPDLGIEKAYTTGLRIAQWGFPGGSEVKNPPCNAGDTLSDAGRAHMPWSN